MKDHIHLITCAILINLCVLISGLAGFLIAWVHISMKQKYWKRPGINIKEF